MKSSSNDISLRYDEDSYLFRYLDWDSNFFKRPCYMFDVDKSHITKPAKIVDLIQTKLDGAFVAVKIVSSYDCNFVQALQKSGFRYIDTEITLEFGEKPRVFEHNNTIKIIKQERNEDLPYEKLGSVFSLTRFHSDPYIPSDKADLIWVNYLKNFVINETHHMYVALVQGEVAGVVLVNIEKKKIMLFYLVAMSSFQNAGVGTKLVQEVVLNSEGSAIQTETQVKNLRALNFYIRNGFTKIYSTCTVMHRW